MTGSARLLAGVLLLAGTRLFLEVDAVACTKTGLRKAVAEVRHKSI